MRGPRRGAYYQSAMVLGSLAALPSPGLPVGTLSGLCLVVLSWQMLQGKKLRVPTRWAHFEVPPKALAYLSKKALRWLPRPDPSPKSSLSPFLHRCSAGWIALMAVLVALPIPLGNVLPGTSVVLAAAAALTLSPKAALAAIFVGLAGLVWPILLVTGLAHWAA